MKKLLIGLVITALALTSVNMTVAERVNDDDIPRIFNMYKT